MLGSLVVLWLGSEPELAERRADIAAWASAHQLQATPLLPMAPSYDAGLAAEVEALLEEARAATFAEATPSALERAEALLMAHPELPQAAWLLAERYAVEAHALGAPGAATGERRRELSERARALEGARATPVAAAPLPAADLAPAVLALPPGGARPHDRVFIDGVAFPSHPPPATALDAVAREARQDSTLAPGQHHVRLTRAGLPVWSGWIVLEAGRAWSLPDPSPPCSALDLADVQAGRAVPEPAPGVRCGRWAVARPRPRGGTDIAECSGSRCGSWRPTSAAPLGALPATEADTSTWPAWATWGLMGAGAIAATGVVLWQVGAFDRGDPATEFVFTGPDAARYHF